MNSLLSFGYAFGLWLWIWFRLFVIRFGERFPFLRFHKPQKAGTNASLALFLLFAVDQNAIKNVRVRKTPPFLEPSTVPPATLFDCVRHHKIVLLLPRKDFYRRRWRAEWGKSEEI